MSISRKKWKFSWAAKEIVFCFIRQNSQIWFFHFGISAFSAIFVLFSFLLCPKPSLNFVKWKWQKKGENVWKGNPWVLLSDKARKGEAGTPVLHIKILGFNRHKRWSFKEDPKYRVRVSASKKIHFGFFFPFQNSKIYGLLFFWERKYKGFFLVQGERLRSDLKLAVVCQVQLQGLWT